MNWISVTQSTPESNTRVLIFDESEGQFVGHLDNSKKYWQMYGTNSQHTNVTHWMSLPETPEKTTEQKLKDFSEDLKNAVTGSKLKVTTEISEMTIRNLAKKKALELGCGVKFDGEFQYYTIEFASE